MKRKNILSHIDRVAENMLYSLMQMGHKKSFFLALVGYVYGTSLIAWVLTFWVGTLFSIGWYLWVGWVFCTLSRMALQEYFPHNQKEVNTDTLFIGILWPILVPLGWWILKEW